VIEVVRVKLSGSTLVNKRYVNSLKGFSGQSIFVSHWLYTIFWFENIFVSLMISAFIQSCLFIAETLNRAALKALFGNPKMIRLFLIFKFIQAQNISNQCYRYRILIL